MSATNILEWARKVQAIAQNGLAFTQDPFDRERFAQLQELVAPSSPPSWTSRSRRPRASGRAMKATPRRRSTSAAASSRDQVLLVRERSDGKWTLPGGWVDVNDGPSFAVEREIREESGYLAKAVKLAALVDKQPATAIRPASSTSTSCSFSASSPAAPPRSATKPTAWSSSRWTRSPSSPRDAPCASQIERLYQHHLNPELPTDFD